MQGQELSSVTKEIMGVSRRWVLMEDPLVETKEQESIFISLRHVIMEDAYDVFISDDNDSDDRNTLPIFRYFTLDGIDSAEMQRRINESLFVLDPLKSKLGWALLMNLDDLDAMEVLMVATECGYKLEAQIHEAPTTYCKDLKWTYERFKNGTIRAN